MKYMNIHLEFTEEEAKTAVTIAHAENDRTQATTADPGDLRVSVERVLMRAFRIGLNQLLAETLTRLHSRKAGKSHRRKS